jgi:hypothetical protein
LVLTPGYLLLAAAAAKESFKFLFFFINIAPYLPLMLLKSHYF